MPEIQALRGVRYNLEHVGSLRDVVAPPYDVIGPDEQQRLYKRHPANVVRLILNREEPGDTPQSNRYTRAAKHLENWLTEGVLARDAEPALYVYHQEFEYAGTRYNRRGFLARMRLERFGEGQVFPHEETMAGPKQDRLLLTRACRANLSPVFGIYPDEANAVQGPLEQAIARLEPAEAVDDLGVIHRMWAVTDPAIVEQVAAEMSAKPLYIADGHHRYETACNYRDELAAAGPLPDDHPARFVLTMCIGMSDPGMIVLPTHRLFRGLPALRAEELRQRLASCFATQVAGEGADLAQEVWRRIESAGDAGTLGFYCAADERWVLASVSEEGRARMAKVAAEHSDPWRALGVSLLHRLVIETLLEARELPKPRYVHLVEEVVAGLESDEFPLAALVMPATVEDIRRVSEFQERMPAKSTYFYPKLLSGLVINPLA